MILSRFSLEGRTALVTGAGRNIGRSIALGLAEAGANVVVADMAGEDAASVRSEIQAAGHRAIALLADVRDPEQVTSMIQAGLAEFGRIDVLVNNAGGGFFSPVRDMSLNGWEAVIRENLTSVFLCSKTAADPMSRQGKGSIINVSPSTGRLGCPGSAHYAAAKAGIVNLTRTLSMEWAALGIRVNAIAPGPVNTDKYVAMLNSIPGYYEKLVQTVPMGRLGALEEIPPAVVYLASDASSYVTGQTLNIDGGQQSLPMI